MIIFLLLVISALAILITFRLLSRGAGASPLPAKPPETVDLPEKFERLLSEKNQLIDRLEKQVEAERSHRLEFEKVKELLSEEISKLKEQNRGLKISKES